MQACMHVHHGRLISRCLIPAICLRRRASSMHAHQGRLVSKCVMATVDVVVHASDVHILQPKGCVQACSRADKSGNEPSCPPSVLPTEELVHEQIIKAMLGDTWDSGRTHGIDGCRATERPKIVGREEESAGWYVWSQWPRQSGYRGVVYG